MHAFCPNASVLAKNQMIWPPFCSVVTGFSKCSQHRCPNKRLQPDLLSRRLSPLKSSCFLFFFNLFQEDVIFKADSADSDCKWMQALWKAELDRREVENGDFHRGLDNPVPRKRKSKGYRG